MSDTTATLFVLPPLPYAENALEPTISANTIAFHHGKHHRGYIDSLNQMLASTELPGLCLEEILAKTAGEVGESAIFNDAAQAWNHAFYWRSLNSQGGGEAPGPLKGMIAASFGSTAACMRNWAAAAMARFGCGWAWLVVDGERLKVIRGANMDSPLVSGLRPISVIDVWAHDYYLDYMNRRADYVDTVLRKLIDWDSASTHPS